MFYQVFFYVFVGLQALSIVATIILRKKRAKNEKIIEHYESLNKDILCRMISFASFVSGRQKGKIEAVRDFIKDNENWIPKDVVKESNIELDLLEIELAKEIKGHNEDIQKVYDGFTIYDGTIGSCDFNS